MNIILVEDDELDALVVSREIRRLFPQAKVVSVATSDRVRSLVCDKDGGAPDAIIVDQHLPGEDGAELVRMLRKDNSFPDTIFVMLTSDVSDRARALALASDFDAFLTKPVDTRRLRDVLTRRRLFWEKQDLPVNLELYRDIRRTVMAG